MKNWITLLLTIVLGISVTGCSNMSYPSTATTQEYIGMFSGAVLGGVAGSAVQAHGGSHYTAIGIGAVVGALIGGGIGMVLSAKQQPVITPTTSSSLDDDHENLTLQQPKATISSTPSANNTPIAQKPRLLHQNKKLSLWQSAYPSTQWFVDDGKQIG